jgi:hypothetical protein
MICDGLRSLAGYLIKLIVTGIVIYFLGKSYYGNLLRCRLLDASGCLPKIDMHVTITKFKHMDEVSLRKRYSVPENFHWNFTPGRWTFAGYNVTLKNTGFESTQSVALHVKPLATSPTLNARLVGYRLKVSKFPPSALTYNANESKFQISGALFRDSPDRSVKDQAQIDFVVGYPSENYTKASDEVLILEAVCNDCQVKYSKTIVGKEEN